MNEAERAAKKTGGGISLFFEQINPAIIIVKNTIKTFKGREIFIIDSSLLYIL